MQVSILDRFLKRQEPDYEPLPWDYGAASRAMVAHITAQVEYERSIAWRFEQVGIGVARCPVDPENEGDR